MIRPFTQIVRSLLTVPVCVWGVAACSAPDHSEIFSAQRAAGENLETGSAASGSASSVMGSGGAASGGGKLPTGGRSGLGKVGGAPAIGSGGAANVVDPNPGDTGGTGGGVIDETGGAPNETGGAANGSGGKQGGACIPTAEVCDGLDNNCKNGTTDEVCPTGCKGVGIPGHGYMFCDGLEYAWLGTRMFCKDHGMSMLKLETADENRLVSAAAAALPNGGIEWAWMGASDAGTEGTWLWEGGAHFWQGEANGMPVEGRFSAWMDGQPNNNNNEDCGRVYPTDANWSDGDCTAAAPSVICETE